MLDCISGGRLVAGFPVGTPMDTCFAYGQNPSQLRARYHEAHDLILKAWTEPDVFSFNGRYNKQRYVNIWPRTLQKPHPPIWIPGGGSVETWHWCAERDYVYAYLSYFGYQAGQDTMNGFWKEMKELGKEPNPYRAGFLQFVGVAETEKEALEIYREPAEYFYKRCLHLSAKFASPPGYMSEATMAARVQSQIAQAAAQAGGRVSSLLPDSFEEMVAKGYVIIGSPDQVADKLKEVATSLNVGQLMLLLQFGNMKKDVSLYNTKLFAAQVRPQIQNLFDDQWENRWWPTPLEASERAALRELPA